MKYEEEILAAYARVGYDPRGRQVEDINAIVTAFVDEGNKNVILHAPTGTGKSLIGVIVAEVIQSLTKKANPAANAQASFLLTATNVLSQQYYESFASDNDPNFVVIKGARNYECSVLSGVDEQATAEGCVIGLLQKSGLEDTIRSNCMSCEYRNTRAKRDTTKHVVTNYSYFFIDRMYSPAPMESRLVTVFDEAHLLNDLFVEHNSVFFSEKRLAETVEEIGENLKLGHNEIFSDIKMIREALVKGKITEETYPSILNVLGNTYQNILQAFTAEAKRNERNHSAYNRLNKLAKKYENYFCKIDDLTTFNYPVVFEYKAKDIAKGQNDHECTIKPIFVGDMFATLDNAQYNLLMSATVTEEFVNRTLILPHKTKYIRLAPQFPRENKKIIFFKPQTLNYNTMKQDDVIKKLSLNACQIVDHHTKKNHRGIVLAPSFKVSEVVAQSLRNMGSVKVFEHARGQKLADVLEAFKAYNIKNPAVIITPSGYEGVDLPGEFSRYQILLKHPYASLGDKRMKHILDNYPSVYQIQSTMKIVQGAGRSVRSADDWATTYCLDVATQRAWNSSLNEWKDEFQSVFSSILED